MGGMTPAQAAQQNNRDDGGRYATRIHAEQDRFEAPQGDPGQVRADELTWQENLPEDHRLNDANKQERIDGEGGPWKWDESTGTWVQYTLTGWVSQPSLNNIELLYPGVRHLTDAERASRVEREERRRRRLAAAVERSRPRG